MNNAEGFYDKATYYIKFEINKHGQSLGCSTVEERVNGLSNNELLELIAEAIDAANKSQ